MTPEFSLFSEPYACSIFIVGYRLSNIRFIAGSEGVYQKSQGQTDCGLWSCPLKIGAFFVLATMSMVTAFALISQLIDPKFVKFDPGKFRFPGSMIQ